MFGDRRDGSVVPVLQEPADSQSKGTIDRQGIPQHRLKVKVHPRLIKDHRLVAVDQYAVLKMSADCCCEHELFQIPSPLN